MTAKNIQLAAFEPRSNVNGPGIRAVLWVQGCHRRCEGCFNPEFLPFEGGTDRTVDDLFEEIGQTNAIGGVTFSGGEPFEQAGPLAELARRCQQSDLSVLIFTGYQLAELTEPAHRLLLAQTDLLVAGPYRHDQPMRHALLASRNQRMHFLTDRCRGDTDDRPDRRAEFHITVDGSVRQSGFAADLLNDSGG